MKHARRRGYTAVELLMAISIFAIGASGIIAMQKVTLRANQHAKDLTVATHIAQAWLDVLATDAMAWNHPSPGNNVQDRDNTNWLKLVDGNEHTWLRPAYVLDRDFGAAFDALGNPLDDAVADQAVYCAHIRLTWLYPDTAGNGLLRAEVRVFWLRDGMGGTADGAALCATPPAAVENLGIRYHFVYQATAIKQNTSS
jgi:prepilin-type N-terminal cleavage/methylation domain-containing protein